MIWCGLPPAVAALAVVVWALLDAAYPYHSGALLAVHPVRTSYLLARRLHRPGAGVWWGAALFVAVLSAHVLPYALAYYALACYVGWAPALTLAVWMLKVSAALRLLTRSVGEVGEALASGDLAAAKEAVKGLVRRDVSGLGAGHVASAAIEALAESLVDGFTSPLTYYALAGPSGALVQRVVNTLDGAVGFLDEEHALEGRASAYADTVLNYVPARYTAALIVLAAALTGLDAGRAMRCWRNYSGVTASRNAGHPMAAMAGALNVWLEKVGHYRFPCGGRPGPGHIRAALRVSRAVALIHVAATAALAYAIASLLH